MSTQEAYEVAKNFGALKASFALRPCSLNLRYRQACHQGAGPRGGSW